MNRQILLVFFVVLLLPSLSSAQSGHIPLLTVAEGDGNETVGGVADLYLEIKPGTGKVFIDSFPLTKLDTQISTRFAKKVACDFLKKDCDKYDFFYQIRSKSTIVGGPSAGAAITVLTISLLGNMDLSENVVITGTINSGGLVGPVAGIPEKLVAARDQGYGVALIPSLSLKNKSLSVPGIEVVPISNIKEAMSVFTGKTMREESGEIVVPESYTTTMKELAEDLCSKASRIFELRWDGIALNGTPYALLNNSLDYYVRGEDEKELGHYYTAASLCYTSNLRLRTYEYLEINDTVSRSAKIREALLDLDKRLEERELETLTDLEAYMIVKERVVEALNFISLPEPSGVDTAFALERYSTALSWSKFFGLPGKKLVLDKSTLEKGCIEKLTEAEERINYAALYLPLYLDSAKEELRYGYYEFEQGRHELCLFRASKAKAEADLIISSLTVSSDQIEKLLDAKLELAEEVIIDQQKKGVFPILGYSYLEYARYLRDTDPFSGLTFAEYALELSHLDVYFPKRGFSLPWDFEWAGVFLIGAVSGLLIGLFLGFRIKRGRV